MSDAARLFPEPLSPIKKTVAAALPTCSSRARKALDTSDSPTQRGSLSAMNPLQRPTSPAAAVDAPEKNIPHYAAFDFARARALEPPLDLVLLLRPAASVLR